MEEIGLFESAGGGTAYLDEFSTRDRNAGSSAPLFSDVRRVENFNILNCEV